MANRDQVIGGGLLVASLVIIIVYLWLIFVPPSWNIFGDPIDIFMLKLTGTFAIVGFFGILAWIGYTLATTPPPKPIEEIEKELEEELKKIEKELEEKGEKSEEGGGEEKKES